VHSPDKDRAFFEEGLQHLETYLLSKELYWPTSIHTTDFTQVTLGAMLLVRQRLKGWSTPGLMELSMQMDTLRLQWRSAWDAKASREVRARSELWKDVLVEARQASAESARQYPYQVRLRVILSRLVEDLRQSPLDALTDLDAELRRVLCSGSFIWDPALEWVFPLESFWFLYGTLKAQEKLNV
jgi:hypothetical protein